MQSTHSLQMKKKPYIIFCFFIFSRALYLLFRKILVVLEFRFVLSSATPNGSIAEI
jgi:hypothetical protein